MRKDSKHITGDLSDAFHVFTPFGRHPAALCSHFFNCQMVGPKLECHLRNVNVLPPYVLVLKTAVQVETRIQEAKENQTNPICGSLPL
jgi:hypothetical protein